MNNTSDLDDSDFLTIARPFKRRADIETGQEKRFKLSENKEADQDSLVLDSEMQPMENAVNQLHHCHTEPDVEKNEIERRLEMDMQGVTYQSKFNIERCSTVVGEKTKGMVASPLQDYFSCPLCMKMFDSEFAHISHMKQCRKKSKLTAKQLLEALEVHKKHLKERIAFGLSHPIQRKKAKIKSENCIDSMYELSLGLALSKSLADEKANGVETLSSDDASAGGPTTLENFGFTNTRNHPLGIGKKSARSCRPVHSTLRKRTKEDRERLITEKAGIVLLTTDKEMELMNIQVSLEVRLASRNAHETGVNTTRLWDFGGSQNQTEWYVEGIKTFIIENDLNGTEEKETIEDNKSDDIQAEIKKLNLPKASLVNDWKKLINNKYLSDLNFLTEEGEVVYVHSLVAFARCPSVLDPGAKVIFSTFKSNIVKCFLKYLYCGVFDDISREEVKVLSELARLLKYDELVRVLIALQELKLETEEFCESAVKKSIHNISRKEIEHSPRDCLHSSEPNAVADKMNCQNFDSQELFSTLMDSSDSTIVSEGILTRQDSPTEGNGINENLEAAGVAVSDVLRAKEDVLKPCNVGPSPAEINISEEDMFKEEEKEQEAGDILREKRDQNEMSFLVSCESSPGCVPTPAYEVPEFDPYECLNNSLPDIHYSPSHRKCPEDPTALIGDIHLSKTDPIVCVPSFSSTPLSVHPLLSDSGECIDGTDDSKPHKSRGSNGEKCNSSEAKGNDAKGSKTEVSPSSSWEESSAEASPAPDYSIMGTATIRKHLMKYGLKRSLSKNKAKKILRHIYDELHPVLNLKSGKIVKLYNVGRMKTYRASSGKIANRRRLEKGRNHKRKSRNSIGKPVRKLSRIREKDSGRISEDNVDESETNFSSAEDIPGTVLDFIRSNWDIRRQILMYEPIGLEDFRRKLNEKYNKKYKFSSLIDYLDTECVYFRYENKKESNEDAVKSQRITSPSSSGGAAELSED